MTALALRLCGDVNLMSPDGVPVAPPLGAKTLALLAFLVVEPGPHRREKLTALLWGDYPKTRQRVRCAKRSRIFEMRLARRCASIARLSSWLTHQRATSRSSVASLS